MKRSAMRKRLRASLEKVKIEKNIPVMEDRGLPSAYRDLAMKLEIGNSVVVKESKIAATLRAALHRLEKHSISRRLEDGSYRVWVIKKR